MLKKLVIIVSISLSLIVIFNADAYSVNFETYGPLVYQKPTVCIMEPDWMVDDITRKGWINHAGYAIGEWEAKLKDSERMKDNKPIWTIEIKKILAREEYDLKKCFVTIKFESEAQGDARFKVAGITQSLQSDQKRSLITVYAAGVGTCSREDQFYIYYFPCYSGYRTFEEIGTIVRHEFGHSMGLGHYSADDPKVNESWAAGTAPAPSIMTNFIYEKVNEQKIRQIDVDKIREIYGKQGFQGSAEKKPTLQKQKSTTSTIFVNVKKGVMTKEQIDGRIPKQMLVKGMPITIMMLKPDNTKETINAKVLNNGAFKYPLIFDSNSQLGKYQVIVKYMGNEIKNVSYVVSQKR